MKSILIGTVLMVVISVVAAFVLDAQSTSTQTAYSSGAGNVRLDN